MAILIGLLYFFFNIIHSFILFMAFQSFTSANHKLTALDIGQEISLKQPNPSALFLINFFLNSLFLFLGT